MKPRNRVRLITRATCHRRSNWTKLCPCSKKFSPEDDPPKDREGMKMAKSLAIPEESLKVGTSRHLSDLISQAQAVLLVCLGYYAGAWIAKALRFPESHLALIWPPTAILLAALLLVPLRKW